MKPLEKEILKLEQLLFRQEIRKSKKLTDFLATSFKEFTSTGKTFSKKQIALALKKENPNTKRKVSNFKIVVLSSGVVLATYKVKTTREGKSAFSLRSSLWQKKGKKWQMVFHQGTLIQ